MSTVNAIEQLKAVKNGLDVRDDILRWAKDGWESIPKEELDRLKWYGIFFRKATPGYFMVRVRVPNGILQQGELRSDQFRELAAITAEFGRDIIDITTRQQIQLRWIPFHAIPEILERLNRVSLTTMQTGIDNVRNITGCPVCGLDSDEVIDASPLVRQLTDLMVGNRSFTDLPRKFNVTIIGCRDDCAHAEINDLGLTPAIKEGHGVGFNVRVGGALGSWGTQKAWPLDAFVRPEQAVELCRVIIEIFRDHGLREHRSKARLKFLIDQWGLDRFREEVVRRCGFPLETAGVEQTRRNSHQDHIGVHLQKQAGLHYVGLLVPAGRLKLQQAFELARLAETYGNGELRLTSMQNVIIPNVPADRLDALLAEPLLAELSCEPSPFARGMIACTGNSFCPFALIETKDRAREVADYLEARFTREECAALGGAFRLHVSGCPNSCGQPHLGDVGLIGRKVKVDGEMAEGADLYLGGELGLFGAFNERYQQNVPFSQLGPTLEAIIRRFLGGREPGETFRQWSIRTGLIKGELTTFAPMLAD